MEVVDSGRVVEVRPNKIRMLLAVLLLHANEVVSSDRLVEALWGESPPTSAANTLQGYLSQLRNLLEPDRRGTGSRVVLTRSPGYLLAVASEEIDATRFERLAAEGRKALAGGDADGASTLLAEALSLWRGHALADFTYEQFAQDAITRLEELRLGVLEDHFGAQLALGRHGNIVGELQSLVARHPLRERLRGHLMTALYRTGRHTAALSAYQDLRSVLGEELGLDPGPELVRLEQAILMHDPQLEWRPNLERPATVRPQGEVQPSTLAQLSSFVGRERELAQVGDLLSTTRLLTLTGAGGCGKTRLALEVATRYVDRRAGPVHLLELAAVNDRASMAGSLAGAVGVREQPGRSLVETAADGLNVSGSLLVVDNCEHLLDDAALLVEGLLKACPGLTILATSREPLRLAGETTWRVPSLATPDSDEHLSLEEVADYEALRLFVERASSVAPDFRLTAGNAAAVARLCRRLDGMPLALELAAARVRALSPGDLADRLDDRFRLLAGGSRSAPRRHQTLRAAINWSYDVLSDEERALLAGVSVFSGRFTLAACEAVCGAAEAASVPVLLSALVDKSLVVVERTSDGCDYRLLETVRQYAGERLDESGTADDVRERHAAYYLGLAEEAEQRLKGHDLDTWLHRLDPELENIRSASAFFERRGDGESVLRISSSLWRFFYLKGHYERGLKWLADGIAGAPGASAAVRAKALYGAGALRLYRCEYEEAAASCMLALRLYEDLGDRLGVARSLTVLGSVARERGALDEALALHEQALSVFSELGDTWGVADSLQLSGLASWLRGDYQAARDASQRSMSLFRTLGDTERIAWAELNLAAVALYTGDTEEAAELLEDSLRLFRRVEFKEGVAWALNLLGVLAHRSGALDRARELLDESLALHVELGDRWREASVLEAHATVAAAEKEFERAARLIQSAQAIRTTIGAPVPPCERSDYERTVGGVVVRLGGDLVTASAWST